MSLAVFGVAACDDDPPTEPDNNTVVFTANMTAAQETTAVTGAEAGATGTATITFNLTRGAGDVITGATANFSSTVSNMPAGSSLILAHIHTGAAGQAGGFVVNTGLSAASAIPIVNGTATLTFNNIVVDPAVAQNIIDNPAGFYFNVHSAAHPGGVVRGQLVRQ
jgi:hypothetical protein